MGPVILELSPESAKILDRIMEKSGFDMQRSVNLGLNFLDMFLDNYTKESPPSFPPIPPLSPNNNIINKNKSRRDLFNTNTIPYVAAEVDRQPNTVKKLVKKNPKMEAPKEWVEAADFGVCPDQSLIDYAEKNGFDRHQATDMFINFINHHLKNGNKWARWDRAFYTWVRNQRKFEQKMSGLPGNRGTIAQFRQL